MSSDHYQSKIPSGSSSWIIQQSFGQLIRIFNLLALFVTSPNIFICGYALPFSTQVCLCIFQRTIRTVFRIKTHFSFFLIVLVAAVKIALNIHACSTFYPWEKNKGLFCCNNNDTDTSKIVCVGYLRRTSSSSHRITPIHHPCKFCQIR